MALSKEAVKERALTCKGCEKLTPVVHICKVCKCFMPAKILFADVACPIGKW